MLETRGVTALCCGVLTSLLTAACQPPPIDLGVSETSGGEVGDGDPGDGDPGDGDPGDGDPGDGDPGDDPPRCADELDILFVIDNSGSMGPIQGMVATGIAGLLPPLDAAGVDWRVGVTTSDNGNPWCPAEVTTPEAGKLVLSSCRSRLDDFVFNNGAATPADPDAACIGVCRFEDIAISPTSTEFDPEPAPRPWIQSVSGVTNLADDLDPAAALACVLPQGIKGCAFESQLESAYLSLQRAADASDSQYGFLRSGADLLIVIVSDEVDCSSNANWAEIFEQDGNRAFWEDPQAEFPTSAVCWNAGVACTGDPSGYDSCDPVNLDRDGVSTSDDDAAVLYPISRYRGLLDELEQQKRQLDPAASVRVSIVGGVGPNGSPTYADALVPDDQIAWGIGYSCQNGEITALPPVRMRDLSSHTGGIMRSICADEYATALAEMVAPFVEACG